MAANSPVPMAKLPIANANSAIVAVLTGKDLAAMLMVLRSSRAIPAMAQDRQTDRSLDLIPPPINIWLRKELSEKA